MLKVLPAMALAAALCLQPAVAAQLGGALTASESGEKANAKKERKGFIAFVIEQMRFSYTAIAGESAGAGGGKYHYSYTKEECEAADKKSEEKSDPKEAKQEEATGPEPLYFGF